ncbi:MAG: ABC transporter permease [Candidatus Saccharimonadales bacterium]
MKRYLTTVLTLGQSFLRRFMRDPVALFFTFLFPLLFLVVFGLLFRSSDVSFDIAIINHSESTFAKDFVHQLSNDKSFKIKTDITSVEAGKEKMGRGEVESLMELPKNFGEPNDKNIPSGDLVVYYDEASPEGGRTVASVMQGFLDGVNKDLTKTVDPLNVRQEPTKTSNLSQFDYTFSGLLGFSILSLGIFGLANGFPADKKNGVLRRLRATPLTSSQLVLSTLMNYAVVGLASLVIMFIVGLTLFDFNMRGNYLDLAIFALLGIVVMFGFGLAIGGWAKNENQSAPLSNLVAFPLMFLSGIFFPRFLMPEWLQSITNYLPLAPIVDGLRYIMTEGQTLFDLGPELLIMGGWIIVIYALAFKIFRWE